MASRSLSPDEQLLENMLAETFMAGCNGHYPESRSDLTYGIRALMTMFDCKRLAIARELKFEDDHD